MGAVRDDILSALKIFDAATLFSEVMLGKENVPGVGVPVGTLREATGGAADVYFCLLLSIRMRAALKPRRNIGEVSAHTLVKAVIS